MIDMHFYSESLNGDTYTPITLFHAIEGKNKALLESSFVHETKGRFSFIAFDPFEEIKEVNGQCRHYNFETNKETDYPHSVTHYLKHQLPKLDFDLELPFYGGAIGFIGFDSCLNHYEIQTEQEKKIQIPDSHFMIYKQLIVYEHKTEKIHLIALDAKSVPKTKLQKRVSKLKETLLQGKDLAAPKTLAIHFKPSLKKEAFKEKLQKGLDFVLAGEVEQIVISQHLVAKLTDPFDYYRHLRVANPSPYMFYLDFGDYLIIGASPESLIEVSQQKLMTNPIAGTRPRGANELEDKRLQEELLTDKKELAEHDMLVELSKQDLLKVCESDSISVPINKRLEFFEHVMHLTSQVHGKLKPNLTGIDVLDSALPAGTVSGSPRQRALELITEIEDDKRHFYAGAVGYISFTGDLNLAISIRSLVVQNGFAHLYAGAGIVKDSDIESEYQETLHKARSLTDI